jgi:hypothetical protein
MGVKVTPVIEGSIREPWNRPKKVDRIPAAEKSESVGVLWECEEIDLVFRDEYLVAGGCVCCKL